MRQHQKRSFLPGPFQKQTLLNLTASASISGRIIVVLSGKPAPNCSLTYGSFSPSFFHISKMSGTPEPACSPIPIRLNIFHPLRLLSWSPDIIIAEGLCVFNIHVIPAVSHPHFLFCEYQVMKESNPSIIVHLRYAHLKLYHALLPVIFGICSRKISL